MAVQKESGVESSEILRILPTFVWKTQFKADVHVSINEAIVKQLDEIAPALKPGQSWQSKQELHKLAEFQNLVSCINTTAKSVLHFLRVSYDAFEITACWANVSATGAVHKVHSHPNNFLTGVYYVQTQEGANTINFHDPRLQTTIIRPAVTQLTAENTDQVLVRVQNGTLIMFPAWLQHSVDANNSDKKRISASFNIMFSSYMETMSKPLWEGGVS